MHSRIALLRKMNTEKINNAVGAAGGAGGNELLLWFFVGGVFFFCDVRMDATE